MTDGDKIKENHKIIPTLMTAKHLSGKDTVVVSYGSPHNEEYIKVAYSPDNGYETRGMKRFKTRRFFGKKRKEKTLITSGRIDYFMSEDEKKRCHERVMANITKIVLK